MGRDSTAEIPAERRHPVCDSRGDYSAWGEFVGRSVESNFVPQLSKAFHRTLAFALYRICIRLTMGITSHGITSLPQP
jgi:hypothetical protein